MRKAIVLAICVFVLVGMMTALLTSAITTTATPTPISTQSETELAYDDGSNEFGFVGSPWLVGATKFTVSSRVHISKLKFFVFGTMKPVRVHVLDANFNSIFSREVTPFPGWYEVDISNANVFESGDFYVGWQWINECPEGPWLGVDNSPPYHQRNYQGIPGQEPNPSKSDEDYLIRAIVYAEAPTLTPTPAGYVNEIVSAQNSKDLFLFEPWVDGLEANINFVIYTPSNYIHWDWGDGSESDSGTHVYSKSGTYIVTVTLDTKEKGKISEKIELTVDATKSAEDLEEPNNLHRLTLFSPEIAGLRVTIGGVVVAPVERIEWDWGDGQRTAHSGFGANHTYPHSGTYIVKVTTYDKKGRTTSKEVTVTLSPTSAQSKSKILFDESHHQRVSIDFVLSDFAKELRNKGYQVDKLTDGPITYDTLKYYDVFVMPNGWIMENEGVKLLTEEETKAIKKFVADGGGLFLHGGGWPWVDYTHLPIEQAQVNQIGKEFGIKSNDDIIYDPTDYYVSCSEGEGCPIFHRPFIKEHPITKEVYEITNCKAFPSSLTISYPSSVDVIISGDEDSYTGYRGKYYKKGENPPFLAVTEYGKGKVVFAQSEVFLSSDDHNKDGIKNLYEFDNLKLGLNIIDWLASGMIAPTTTPIKSITPTPTSASSHSISPLFLIGAAVLVISLIAGIGRSRKGKGGKTETTKPKPPVEPPEPKSEAFLLTPPVILEPPAESPKPKAEQTKPLPTSEPTYLKRSNIKISSEFGYKGATILYKIKVTNSTPEPISDIRISLFVPDVFLLKEKEKRIAMLEPNESSTVTFEIRPTGECGDCNVSGIVYYYDYSTKKRQELNIEVKSLSIVCPMLRAKEIDKTGWKETVSRLIQVDESVKDVQIGAETLFTVASRVIGNMNMFMLEPEITSSPQLFTGIAYFYAEGVKGLRYAVQLEVIGGTQKSKLILTAWAEKETALIGFYHGMLDRIEKRVQVKDLIEGMNVFVKGDYIAPGGKKTETGGDYQEGGAIKTGDIGMVKGGIGAKKEEKEDEK